MLGLATDESPKSNVSTRTRLGGAFSRGIEMNASKSAFAMSTSVDDRSQSSPSPSSMTGPNRGVTSEKLLLLRGVTSTPDRLPPFDSFPRRSTPAGIASKVTAGGPLRSSPTLVPPSAPPPQPIRPHRHSLGKSHAPQHPPGGAQPPTPPRGHSPQRRQPS